MKFVITFLIVLLTLPIVVMTAQFYKTEIFGLYNKYRPLLLNGGGDDCLEKLTEKHVQFRTLGDQGTEMCPVRNAVKVFKLGKAKPSSSFTLSCSAALDLANWVDDMNVTSFTHMGTLNCRKMRGRGLLSEHSFGTAIDISEVNGASVKNDWGAQSDKGKFLVKAADNACSHFSNVLTPDSNRLHHDHFHFDNGIGNRC